MFSIMSMLCQFNCWSGSIWVEVDMVQSWYESDGFCCRYESFCVMGQFIIMGQFFVMGLILIWVWFQFETWFVDMSLIWYGSIVCSIWVWFQYGSWFVDTSLVFVMGLDSIWVLIWYESEFDMGLDSIWINFCSIWVWFRYGSWFDMNLSSIWVLISIWVFVCSI